MITSLELFIGIPPDFTLEDIADLLSSVPLDKLVTLRIQGFLCRHFKDAAVDPVLQLPSICPLTQLDFTEYSTLDALDTLLWPLMQASAAAAQDAVDAAEPWQFRLVCDASEWHLSAADVLQPQPAAADDMNILAAARGCMVAAHSHSVPSTSRVSSMAVNSLCSACSCPFCSDPWHPGCVGICT